MLIRGWNQFLALGAIPSATLAFTFINPASHGGQTSFAQNTVYAEKSILEVQWTSGETDQDATVALFQVDITTSLATDVSPDTIGDLEYIAEGQDWDRTSRRWIVVTNKDLTVSPVFMMMLFVTGATNASDETIYFNISSTASTTTTSSASGSSTSLASMSSSSSTSSPSTSAFASASPSASITSDNSAALPTSAKIGMGVGIPAAAIIGVVAGWLAFRRRKAQNQSSLGGLPQEEKASGFDDSTIVSPRPASSTLSYGPASNAPVYGPASSAPIHRPASSAPVYEAGNEQSAPSELYAPHTTRY